MVTSTLFATSRIYSAVMTAGHELPDAKRDGSTEERARSRKEAESQEELKCCLERDQFGSQIRLVPGSGGNVAQALSK